MRRYEEKDYSMIQEWCELRSVSAPPEWSLPANGFVVDKIACGFLIVMDNKCGLIDFYISNPFSSAEQRDAALDQITEEIVSISKKLKLKVLLCDTQLDSVRIRAMRHGFIKNGEFTHFMREL